MYISRMDKNGNSLSTRIYNAVQDGDIEIKEIKEFNGTTRLDQYAAACWGAQYSRNWWIIAAASGIGWIFDLSFEEEGVEEPVTIIIPELKSVIEFIKLAA